MAGNKPAQLTAAQDNAPVLENDGDIFAPLRRLRDSYSFHEARFHNLLTSKHELLKHASKDEKPKLHALISKLEKVRNYYGGALLAVAALIPNPYESALTAEIATA